MVSMEQITNFIQTTNESTKKKQLHKSIVSKRERLTRLITKNEMLKVELDMVRQEYDVRVGSLYLKDNQLDLEIIHYKNIVQLMDEGKSYEEAVKALEETFYAEQLIIEKEKEKIREEEEILIKREAQEPEAVIEDIKKLWKRLIARFHPDLVQETGEKKRSEEIIKQVNRAYEEYDFALLQRIENDSHIETFEESTLEKLEEILVAVENEIITQMALTEELKSSEWVAWKNRIAYARKRNIDIFKDIERKLLDDIVGKYAILNKLKAQVSS
ncbi:hypothetical protein BH11PAT1_BH11PAT1_2070 [soil metagenome]